MPDTEKMLELAIEILESSGCPADYDDDYETVYNTCDCGSKQEQVREGLFSIGVRCTEENVKACWRKYLEMKAKGNDDRA